MSDCSRPTIVEVDNTFARDVAQVVLKRLSQNEQVGIRFQNLTEQDYKELLSGLVEIIKQKPAQSFKETVDAVEHEMLEGYNLFVVAGKDYLLGNVVTIKKN